MQDVGIRHSTFSEAKTLPIVGNEMEVTGKLCITITFLHKLSLIYTVYTVIVVHLLTFQSKDARLRLSILKQNNIFFKMLNGLLKYLSMCATYSFNVIKAIFTWLVNHRFLICSNMMLGLNRFV